MKIFRMAAALLLAACSGFEPPSMEVVLPEAFLQAPPPLPAAPDAPKVDISQWWKQFNDPALDALVERALAGNLGLMQAAERVRSARALVTSGEAALLPQLSASGSTTYTRRLKGDGFAFSNNPALSAGAFSPDRTSGSYQGGFDASWELPLFGRGFAGVDAAEAALGGAEANAEAARVSLVAEVARTYMELRTAQDKLLIFEQSAKVRGEFSRLVGLKQEQGLANAAEAAQARTAAEQSAAAVPVQRQAVAQKLQRLAVLTGQAQPDATWAEVKTLPEVPPVVSKAVPADLLRVRPEIRAAEQNILQRAAQARLALAELYPQLKLGGSLTASGPLLGASFTGDTLALSGGPSIIIPLLDWGSRLATAEARQAEWAEAIHAYKEAVLLGVEEAENAFATAVAGKERAERLKAAESAAADALSMTDLRYQQGLTDLLDRLTVENALLQARSDAADAKATEALGVIALYKAFGGAGI